MIRCKSTHNSTNRRSSPIQNKYQRTKSNKKIDRSNTKKHKERDGNNIKNCDQLHDKNIEKRINNIKKGFEALQGNLNFDYLNSHEKKVSEIFGLTPRLTQRKNPHKYESTEKLITIKKKKCYTSNNISQRQKKNVKQPCYNQNYHSCIYEESLMNLMKIITLQKKQIQRLKKSNIVPK